MRRPDWQQRFAAVVKEYQRAAFAWGEHDCCLFACDCIHALTGVDPADGYRGTYSTQLQAYKFIREFSGGDVGDVARIMTGRLGFIEVKPVFAQRGDIGLMNLPDLGDTLGVCLGSQFAFMSTAPMSYFDRSAIGLAWSIG